MRLQLKHALGTWAGVLTLLCLPISTLAGPLKIISNSLSTDPVSDGPVTHLTVALYTDGGEGGEPYVMALQLKHYGFIRPIGGRKLLTNREGTVGVINFSLATKTNNTVLILAGKNSIWICPDFNAQVIALCQRARIRISTEYLLVTGVSANVVHLESFDWARWYYELSLRVDRAGKISIVRFKRESAR